MQPTPAVIIDGALPRTAYERCCKVFDYLVEISEDGPHSALDPGHEWQRVFGNLHYDDSEAADDTHVWHDFEDAIVGAINRELPDSFVCTVGEFQPDDVIVREVGEDENDLTDDMADPTQPFGGLI
jgi:hypothetical protein